MERVVMPRNRVPRELVKLPPCKGSKKPVDRALEDMV